MVSWKNFLSEDQENLGHNSTSVTSLTCECSKHLISQGLSVLLWWGGIRIALNSLLVLK